MTASLQLSVTVSFKILTVVQLSMIITLVLKNNLCYCFSSYAVDGYVAFNLLCFSLFPRLPIYYAAFSQH